MVLVGRSHGANAECDVARWGCRRTRPAGRERKHAERSAFFVEITTLSERTISFQTTTRSAREISVCFENRFGFGKIEALEQNLSAFGGLFLWRRVAPTKRFAPFLIHFLARLRAVFCCGGGGSSQRFLWRRPFWQKSRYSQQFCPLFARFVPTLKTVRANHFGCVKES